LDMRLAVLFSGGKDSCYAMYKASRYHEITCLITVESENKESYMFHTPNIHLAQLQAESLGIPLLTVKTKGIKESELKDLSNAIRKAVSVFHIEGIVTGAIASVYQAARIQGICDKLGLWCFNPLWQMDQLILLKELLDNKFEVIISGVFAYPFDESWLGRKLSRKMISELENLQENYNINPGGEGGETESFVNYMPMFDSKILVKKAHVQFSKNAGVYLIDEAALE
jgi:diphthine-ammonia ligase